MDNLNPYAAPATPPKPPPTGGIGQVFQEALEIFLQHSFVIIGAVVVVWLPLELFSSYMDYHVFGPDEFMNSFRLAMFLDDFIGIIATAAVIAAGAATMSKEGPSLSGALSEGLYCWPRMWWTNFLVGIVVFIGFVCLVVPGIYLIIRLCMADSVVVIERNWGFAAMRRSFELTEDRFWYAFGICCVVFGLAIVGMILIAIPVVLFETFDSWITDACSQLAFDIAGAYITLCFFCAYRELSRTRDTFDVEAKW